MSTTRAGNIPPYKRHKASGRGYVQLDGKRRYLGPFDDPGSRERYDRLTAVWLANGRGIVPDRIADSTVDALCDAFQRWVEEEYPRRPGGKPTREVGAFKRVLAPAGTVGGDAGEEVRSPRPADASGSIHRPQVVPHTGQQGRVASPPGVSLGASFYLIPPSSSAALETVEPLRRGRSNARETKAIGPVPIEHVDALQGHVSKQVWALIQIQLRSGARAGEIVGLRPIDLDLSGKVWTYTPEAHKTAHHGIQRRIYFGPIAQELIRPFLVGRPTHAPLFSPREAETERLAQLHRRRETPLSCGNGPGRSKMLRPSRQPGEQYTTGTYGRAIARGCVAAGVPHWHAHQLRHLATDLIAREFGMIAAQIILGHKSLKTTEIYKARDAATALEVAAKIG